MRVGQIVLDLTPLRVSRDFRFLYGARVASLLSVGILSVAVSMHVFALTQSSFHVGLVSLCLAGPMIAGLLVGGVLADSVDRRRLMVATRAAYVLVVIAFLANALSPAPQVWVIYVAAMVAGAINGLSSPPLMAAMPALVGREHLMAAGALITISTQMGAVIGPSLAGTIVGAGGYALCYGLVAGGALMTPILLSRLSPMPMAKGKGPSAGRAFLEGVRFMRSSPMIAGLLVIDIAATIFAMPYAVFPELGATRFHGGPSTIGLLYTAPALGALCGALISGWTNRVAYPGRALIAAVLVWGVATTAFGLSTSFPLALIMLAVSGVGYTTSEILRRALLQHHTPNELQGRVGSLWLMQAVAAPALGNVQAGFTAGIFTPTIAVVAGGTLCVVATLIVAAAFPAIRGATLRPAAAPQSPK